MAALLSVLVGSEEKPDVAEKLTAKLGGKWRALVGDHVPGFFSKGAHSTIAQKMLFF